MKKYIKFGLGLFMASLMFFGVTCKKAAENYPEDIAAITAMSATVMADMMQLSFAEANSLVSQQNKNTGCKYEKKHWNLNARPSCFINPSPGHGWYDGWFDSTVETNCNMTLSLMSDVNCSLGATFTTGEYVSGRIDIDGMMNFINSTSAIDLQIHIKTGATGFVVSGHTHTIHLDCQMRGIVGVGGTITIRGNIDNDVINYSSSY